MIERYRDLSIHYLQNAFEFIDAGDAEKASEFLWGSMAEALKAVAACKGVKIIRHWDIGDYAKNLAKERQDEAITDVFGKASNLHSNFHEGELSMEQVSAYAQRIRSEVDKLLRLIPS